MATFRNQTTHRNNSYSDRTSTPGQKPPQQQAGTLNHTGTGRTTRTGRGASAHTTRRRSTTRKHRATAGEAVKGAENKLRNFRQASVLAVAITGFIMLLFAPSETGLAQQPEAALGTAALLDSTGAVADTVAAPSTKASASEAIGALQNMWNGFLYYLPKILIALATLILAWGITRLLKAILQKTIGRWHSANATVSLVSIAVWLLAVGVALSVVIGDIRALVGSLGLIGLALSWSLQTPIESFTGWLLNSFQGYYRIGDRVQVGDVFGDVYQIDFLTTTVWEIGTPFQSGFVQAEQPTGRMVTFPNNEILTGTVINLTGDFPYVWDELAVAVANESDLKLSMEVLERISNDLLEQHMAVPAKQYARLLKRAGLDGDIPARPQAYLSLLDSWTNVTLRYLVKARERRKWKSELTLRVAEELSKPAYAGKIIPVYPRQQVQFINPVGEPVEIKEFRSGGQAGEDFGNA